MRKVIILLALLLCTVTASAEKSHSKIKKSMIAPIEANDWVYNTDSMNIVMDLEGGDLSFYLKNNKTTNVYIEWDSARINGDRVIFGSDDYLESLTKKKEEVVPDSSFSKIRALLVPNKYYRGLNSFIHWAFVPYDLKKLKQEGRDTIHFCLPLRYTNGIRREIHFLLNLTLVNHANLKTVMEGMKKRNVRKAVGEPDYKEKLKADKTEIWHYTNNGEITFVEGKVTGVSIKRKQGRASRGEPFRP